MSDEFVRVTDLIEFLKKVPPDYLVGYRCCSDSCLLDLDSIRVVRAEDKKIVMHHNLRGFVRDYYAPEWPGGKFDVKRTTSMIDESVEMVPEFVNIVMFPGN